MTEVVAVSIMENFGVFFSAWCISKFLKRKGNDWLYLGSGIAILVALIKY